MASTSSPNPQKNMKTSLILCLATMVMAYTAPAAQVAAYPKAKPLLDLTFPDGWEIQNEGEGLLASPKDDDSFTVLAMPLKSTNEQVQQAVVEAKEILAEDFKNLEYEELRKIEGEGVVTLLLQAKGADDEGKVNLACLIINQPAAESLILVQLISSPEGFDKHGDAGLALIKTVKAHASSKTFAYPAEGKPRFTVDFPADWPLETSEQGCYCYSPDKFVAMNVLILDASEAGKALENIKADIGGKFGEIVWNEGNDPVVNKEEALKLTATFENGLAQSDGKKYSVNVVQYLQEGADKLLILISQHPLPASDEHLDAKLGILKSIKVGNP